MTEHYSKQTVSVSAYCKKCCKYTQHQVHDHRKGACLSCIAKLNAQYESRIEKAEYERQRELFG